MNYLYLARHGQTLFNVLQKKQGASDSPLTDLGIRQAKALGQWIEREKLSFDELYCSTSERASDTLELAVPDRPYTRKKGLKEWNFGVFEGESEKLNPPLPYKDFYAVFGGESEQEVRRRIYTELEELVRDVSDKNIFVVSHGAAIAQFIRAVIKKEELPAHISNCSVSKFSYDASGFHYVSTIDVCKDLS